MSLLVLLGLGLVPAMMSGSYINTVLATPSRHATLTKEEFQKLLPVPLSASDLGNVKKIALANNEVQKIIDGKSYKFMAQDFVGNVYANPVVWNPEIHINIANTTEITTVINLTNKSIVDIEISPLIRLHASSTFDGYGSGSQHSWASDYYSGSYTINGIDAYSYAPSHGTSSTSSNESLLLNAVEAGATNNYLCNSNYWTSDYFAQVGFDFPIASYINKYGYLLYTDSYYGQGNANVANGWTTYGYLLYTDSYYGCMGQNPASKYNIGDLWEFTVQTSGTSWVLSGYDQTTGDSFSYTRSGVTSLSMETSDINTGVFFENFNTGTGWSSTFSGDPSMTSATVHDTSNAVWYNWDSDSEQDSKCAGTPYNDNGNTMSGSLASGGTTSWSVSYIDNNLQAC